MGQFSAWRPGQFSVEINTPALLRRRGRKRSTAPTRKWPRFVARRLVDHLERAEFVVMKRSRAIARDDLVSLVAPPKGRRAAAMIGVGAAFGHS
jgi:hypothetical protein